MSLVARALPVTASTGVGASADATDMGPNKELIIGGVFNATLNLQISTDGGTSWSSVFSTAAAGRFQVSFAATDVRIDVAYVVGMDPGTPTAEIGADAGVSAGLALTMPAGNGAGASVDVSALTDFKTIIVSGPFTGQVNIEGSQDNTTFKALPVSFTNPDNFTLVSASQYMRVVRSGVIPGTPAPTAGVASSQVTSVGASAGGGIFGPFVSPLLIDGGAGFVLESAVPPGMSSAPICVMNRAGRVVAITCSIMQGSLGPGETIDFRPNVSGTNGFSAIMNEGDAYARAQGSQAFVEGDELRGVGFGGATLPNAAYTAMWIEIEYDA